MPDEIIQTTIRFPPEVYRAIETDAQRRGVSINQAVIEALRRAFITARME